MQAIDVQQQYIDVGYCSIWTEKYSYLNTENLTPILVIHGGPGLSHRYLLELKELASNRPVIFYDQSGCDNSKILNVETINWTLDHYVKELSLIITNLGLSKVILLGYSWGAAIAVKYASENPMVVEKLILASPYMSTPHLLENYKELAQKIGIYDTVKKHEDAKTMHSPEYQKAMTMFFKNFIFQQDSSIFGEIVINKEISEAMWGPYEFSVTGTLQEMNLIPLLATLKMPLLFTSGKNDTMTPSYMKMLQQQVKNSKWVVFNKSSHMPHIEEKEKYLEVINEFVNN